VFFHCIISKSSIYQIYKGIKPKGSRECCWLAELFVEVMSLLSFHKMVIVRAKLNNKYNFMYTELYYQASTAAHKKNRTENSRNLILA